MARRTGIQAALSQQLLVQLVNGLGVATADAANYWFYGNFQKAFAYMENWPITVVQAPVNSEVEFTHDIPFRWKASERGTPAVLDPRFVQRHRAISTSSSSGSSVGQLYGVSRDLGTGSRECGPLSIVGRIANPSYAQQRTSFRLPMRTEGVYHGRLVCLSGR